jgi:hypothetical protein
LLRALHFRNACKQCVPFLGHTLHVGLAGVLRRFRGIAERLGLSL